MGEIPIYIFAFVALYAQVYLIIVIFEKWDTIFADVSKRKLSHYPNVVIAVPCWNESKTLRKTIESLLNLDYPKDKLKIWVVDDGSKDNTWEEVQKAKAELDTYNQLTIKTKENGGKHTVLNFVLEHNPNCDIFGCLDADSYVFPDTLHNMLLPFEEKKVMAVTPMLIVRKPKNILQAIQSVEYNFGLFLKRVFAAINGIHVTPGPFSLMRREVFAKIGNYSPAHQTEDMEIAFRMHKNHMRIESALGAYVETSTPDTVYKLYRQRLRWSQGFMGNSIDYKEMFLNPKYGSIAMITIPLGWFGIMMVVYLAFYWITQLFTSLSKILSNWQALGLDMFTFTFSWSTLLNNIYLETGPLNLIVLPLVISGFIFILTGHSMSKLESRRFRYIIYYLLLWWMLVPFWFTRALYNTLTNTTVAWRHGNEQ